MDGSGKVINRSTKRHRRFGQRHDKDTTRALKRSVKNDPKRNLCYTANRTVTRARGKAIARFRAIYRGGFLKTLAAGKAAAAAAAAAAIASQCELTGIACWLARWLVLAAKMSVYVMSAPLNN